LFDPFTPGSTDETIDTIFRNHANPELLESVGPRLLVRISPHKRARVRRLTEGVVGISDSSRSAS
jgi:hypothetical protein